MTAARTSVVTALASLTGHPTVDDIAVAVAALDAGVHRATVYRTLEALCELGVVQHIHLGHGATAYHIPHPAPHPHAQCRGCGRVIDLPPDSLAGVAATLDTGSAFRLDATHVALSGTCHACGNTLP